MRLLHLALLFCLTPLSDAVAQHRMEVILDDGTILIAPIEKQKIDLRTPYGVVQFPLTDIAQIRFGPHWTDAETETLKRCFLDLDSTNHKERTAAQADFLHMGWRSAIVLAPYKAGPTPEVAKRVQGMLTTLRDRFGDRCDTPMDDEAVMGNGSRFVGRIETKQVAVTTVALGSLTVDVSAIRNMRRLVDAVLKVHAAESGWQHTNVQFSAKAKLKITVAGRIDLWPAQPGQYVVGPNGHALVGKDVKYKGGALLAKIGSGDPFVVGESCEVDVPAGRLQFMVAPSPWDGARSGHYEVRLHWESK